MTSPYTQPDPNADSRGQGSGAPGYGGSAQPYAAPGGSAQPYAAPGGSAQQYGAPGGSAQQYGAPGGSAQQYGVPGGSAQPYAASGGSAQQYGVPGGSAQQYGTPGGSAQPYAAPGGSAQQYGAPGGSGAGWESSGGQSAQGAQPYAQGTPAGGAPGQGDGAYRYQRDDTTPIPLTADSIVMPSAKGAAWVAFILSVPFIAGSIWNVIYLGGEGTVLGIVVLAFFGAFLLFGGFLFRSSSMTIDATGFHAKNMVRSADVPWPASRTGFYVRVERKRRGASALMSEVSARVITPDGRAMPLTGIAWAGIHVAEMEAKGITQCWRLWNWAVAKGFTRETGQYVELSGLGIQQAMRSKQEHLYGIVRG